MIQAHSIAFPSVQANKRSSVVGERHNSLRMVALAQAAAPYWEIPVKIRDVLPEDSHYITFTVVIHNT
jgi:hypothetical protein